MSDLNNQPFFLNLNKFFISDWVNYPPKPYEKCLENEITNNVEILALKMYQLFYAIVAKKEDYIILIKDIEDLIPQCIPFNFYFDLQLAKCNIFIDKYQIDDGFTILKDIEDQLFKNNMYDSYYYQIRKIYYYKLQSIVYHELKIPEKALESGFKGLFISENYNLDHKSFEFYMYNSFIYRNIGDFKKANFSIDRCMDIADRLVDYQKQVLCYSSLSNIAQLDGNNQKGIEYAKKGIRIARKFNSSNLGDCLVYLASAYWRTGNLKEVLDLLLESEVIAKKYNNKRSLFSIYNNLGLYFVTKGDYEQGLEYFFKGKQLIQETKYDIKLPYLYSNLGAVYYEMDDLEKAELYFLKLLEESEKNRNITFQINALNSLILVASLLEDKVKCQTLLEKLTPIAKLSKGKNDKLKYELAQGFVLEISDNLEDCLTALNIFEKIMKMEFIDFGIKNDAYLHYCQTIFRCFLIFDRKIDWDSIKFYLQVLQKESLALNLYNTYFTCEILMSKILSLNFLFQEAEKILVKVLEESEKRGYDLINSMTKEALKTLEIFRIGIENVGILKNDQFEKTRKRKELEQDVMQFIKRIT